MILDITEAAVVVLATGHNPTILHPEFLKSQEIVPKEWQADQDSIVCTPPFSMVKYPDQRMIWIVDPERLQLSQSRPDIMGVGGCSIADLVVKYIDMLPHVPYRAVGINFTGNFEISNPLLFISDKFIKTGPWNNQEQSAMEINIEFTYQVDCGTLKLRISPNLYKPSTSADKKEVIILRANYHFGITNSTRLVEHIKEKVSLYSSRISHFNMIANKLLELEG